MPMSRACDFLSLHKPSLSKHVFFIHLHYFLYFRKEDFKSLEFKPQTFDWGHRDEPKACFESSSSGRGSQYHEQDYQQGYEGGGYGTGNSEYGTGYDTDYPPGNRYSESGAGYPAGGPGYSDNGPGYPSRGPGYSESGRGFSSTGAGYPDAGPGYPSRGGGYPPNGPGYRGPGSSISNYSSKFLS